MVWAGGVGALLAITLVVGCTWIPLDGPLGQTEPPADTDTDTDADSDSDTDADTDADTDTETGVPGEFDLANARALFVGEQPGDHSTAALAPSADLTGDGVTDLAIGSWWWDTNADGSVYLVSADSVGTVSLADAEARLTGSAAAQLVGCSVAVGDLDGDLQDDVLIGANDVGFVVSGPVLGTWRAEDVAVSRFERTGGTTGVCFRLMAAGDINTDGDEDLLIAYDDDYNSVVSVYVADVSLGTSDLDDLSDKIEGPIGSVGAITSADLDGDGVQDVLIGDYRSDSFAGQVSVVHGPIIGVVSPEDADAVMSGAVPLSIFGIIATNAGDLNHDGREDIVVSAPGGSQEPPVPGTVYVWTSELVGAVAASSADAIIDGVDPGSGTGIAVASADVDGDGESDLLLGAPLMGLGTAFYGFGGAYLLHGPFSGTLDVGSATLLRGEASQPTGIVGGPLSTLGDVDGDGLDDLAVSGSGIDAESGGTYVVFGSDL